MKSPPLNVAAVALPPWPERPTNSAEIRRVRERLARERKKAPEPAAAASAAEAT